MRPSALPPPTLPPMFDEQGTVRLARELALVYPDRSPGSTGATGAWRWVRDQLESLGLEPETERSFATIPGRGRVELRNLLAIVPGRSPQIVVVMAHRDSASGSPGENDNASGTATLIELARAYAAAPTGITGRARPNHTIAFLSTDGGAYGLLGAREFARRSPYRDRAVAVLNLDAVGSAGRARLELAGQGSRSPSPVLVGTASARIHDQTGRAPGRPSALGQLVDLAFPYNLYEQAPFLGRGIPAITVTTGGARPSFDGRAELDAKHLGQMGRSAQAILASLDAGLELARGTSGYWYFGGKMVRGWAVEIVLVAMLIPFLAAVVDLFARGRRRRIPLAPAFRSYRSRLAYWLFAGGLFLLFGLLGAWPQGTSAPLNPDTKAAGHWPRLALALYILVLIATWLVARGRLVRRRPVGEEEELAGQTAALLTLGVISLLVVATNAFALVLVLPSLHAWLWLSQVRDRSGVLRGALFAIGLAGPLLLLGSFALRFGLGLDAPWYLAELTAIGYVPIVRVVLFLAWLAAAGQVLAVTTGRYAPYPSAAERPPLGPVRNAVRSVVLASRSRGATAPRRAPSE